MTDKELKKKALALRKEMEQELKEEIKKDLTESYEEKFAKQMEKLEEISNQVSKQEASQLFKIYTDADTKKDIEEADQKELAKAFSYAVFQKDMQAIARISQKSYDLLPESKKKGLSEGVNADGGYLVPEEFYNSLIVELDNTLQLRSKVTVWQMKRLSIEIPRMDNDLRVFWGTEGASKTTTTMNFDRPTLTAYKLVAILRATDEVLDDAVVNIEQLIVQRFARAMNEMEEKAILIGTGTGQPTGLFVDTNVGATAAAGAVTFDKIKTLYYSVPVQYRMNGKWIVSDTTMAKIDKLKDGNNRYLLQDSVADGSPLRMLGKEVINVPDEYMTGKVNDMMFGDIKEAYILGDRHQMRLKVSQDESESFTKDKTAFRVVKRLGGIVIQPKAIKKLTGIS